MNAIIGKLKDKPSLVTLLIILLIAVQIILIKCGIIVDFSEMLRKSDKANDLYLAMLSVAALQARIAAGDALVDNWMSISYSGFLSAGCALFASLSRMMADAWLAPWFFEASILFCIHGVLRLLWLLKQLIKVVRDVDSKEALRASER